MAKARPMLVDRDIARWYPLKDHPVQLALVNDRVRFPIVPAGRRSGKTERFKRFIAKEAMAGPVGPYFIGAPTHTQVKQIYWEDMKRLTFSSLHAKQPTASDLTIYMPSGSTIHLIGLDKPERFEGVPWVGGGIDEIANVKANAWSSNIRPALDTMNPERPGHKAWCWLIGVPEGMNHYYELAEYARTANDPEFKLYHWKSSEILPPEVIEAAKRSMSAKEFRQEYEASFETAGGRIYEDFNAENYTNVVHSKTEPLMWFHDFNYTPLSSGIGVVRNNCLYITDEIVLKSAIARQSAEEFVERYRNHENKTVTIYGDPAGRAGEKHGHASDYTEIEKVLVQNEWKLTRKVKNKAPAIKDRQNAVRAKICNALGERTLFVNPEKAPYATKGLTTVQFKEGSSYIEEESDYQHITTAIGYCVDYEWPAVGRKQTPKVVPIPTITPISKRGYG